jgi:hypothetical protein
MVRRDVIVLHALIHGFAHFSRGARFKCTNLEESQKYLDNLNIHTSTSDDGQHLLPFHCTCKILIALLGDQNIIFNANASHRHVPF